MKITEHESFGVAVSFAGLEVLGFQSAPEEYQLRVQAGSELSKPVPGEEMDGSHVVQATATASMGHVMAVARNGSRAVSGST